MYSVNTCSSEMDANSIYVYQEQMYRNMTKYNNPTYTNYQSNIKTYSDAFKLPTCETYKQFHASVK